MKVCVKCLQEMKCIKNGVLILYHENHGYPGDLFRCPACRSSVVVANSSPIHVAKEDYKKFKQILRMP